jgi:hypothetical protein
MRERRVLFLVAPLLAIALPLAAKSALAATPSFTVSAGNVTMSATAASSVTFTLTSVNGFSDLIEVGCDPTNQPAGATLPLCGPSGGAVAHPAIYTLTANGTVQGSFPLLSTFPAPCSGTGCPVKFSRPRRKGLATGLSLAGALLFGLGLSFRRRATRWLALTLLAFGALAGTAGITACGGSGRTLTPGVWPYTIQAVSQSTDEVVSATINVTVPPGIPVTYQ